ncbi:MAG: hypothetical protein LBP79_03885 [Clostridiales bacterium]|jgi:flagellar biosynthesis protein FlhB|nr:hypothetical protein [Clostridiales bacterium]
MKDKLLAFFKNERVKQYLPKVIIILLCVAATVIFFTGNMFKITVLTNQYPNDTYSIFYETIFLTLISLVFLFFIIITIIILLIEKK